MPGRHRCEATAHYGVQVVRQREETRIVRAAIEGKVIPNAIGQTGLVVVQERVDRHIFHPLLHVQHALHVGGVGGGGCAVGEVERADQRKQIGPLVLDRAGLLEVGVGVGGHRVVGALPTQVGHGVLEQGIAQGRLTDPAIGIALGIERKLALDQVIVVLLVGRVGPKGIVIG